jgi:hypothetical protein
MNPRILLLTLLCLALTVAPAAAQCGPGGAPDCGSSYDNGPPNGTVDAWTINFGYVVSDTFVLSSASTIQSFNFWVWAYPGDTALTVDWSITSAEFGGTTYGSGTASLSSTFLSSNQYGYDIDKLSASGLNVALGAGTYWLNLANATTAFGDPLFWDENSGPSSASESAVGTIASEAFNINGPATPEPSSILLFGSGILGLAGVLRRKLFP